MVWRLIRRACVLLVLGYQQDAYSIVTPLGDINNVTTVRQQSGIRAAEITFSQPEDNHQALQAHVQPVHGDVQTVSLPLRLLSQIQAQVANLRGINMLITHIPAALVILTMMQDLPQVNQHLSIQQVAAVHGIMHLTLDGLSQNGQEVSTQIVISQHLPGQIQVSLPTGFFPTSLLIDMLPQLQEVPIPIPSLVEVLHMLNRMLPVILMPLEVDPLTGQTEAIVSFWSI